MKTLPYSKRFAQRRGQVLPVSIIILAVLLVLGFVFLGILNRNLQQGATGQRRSEAEDLARAGVDYAHRQLMHSDSRADYRPPVIQLAATGVDFTRDPDAFYLRPGSGLPFRNGADTMIDRGGPDGLGPYSRYLFERGRALVRISYRPSDANLFDANPTGPLRQPGLARSYITIEVIGRVGRLDPNDPTTLTSNSGVQFRNYPDFATMRAAYEDMRTRDNQFVGSRKLMAFASIGMLEHSLYVTDLDDSSLPADIGIDLDGGANFNGIAFSPPVMYGGSVPGPAGSPVQGGGGIWINGNARFFGNVAAILNQGLGDKIIITDSVIGGNDSALLRMIRKVGDESSTVNDDVIDLSNNVGTINAVPSPGRLDSSAPGFLTYGGLFRDGYEATDPDGWSRYGKRKLAPRFTEADPQTGIITYFKETAQSGALTAAGNIGRFGYGQGVYVGNLADRQIGSDEDARENAGSNQSLIYDWLNPNNGQPGSGWQGQFYIPVGATMRLTWDGFVISRDGRAPANQRTWRRQDGSDSGKTSMKYRIGGDPDGAGPQPPYIINELTNVADINAANPTWTNGVPFNGLVYFEGNVRVRGTIPTDVQMTLISMANIYIEGSITKGNVVDAAGTRLARPSASTLMLMAKDYVVMNTTMFFGPATGSALEEVNETNDPLAGNSVRLRAAGGSISLLSEYMLRFENIAGLPGVTENNPQTWRPFAMDYVDPATNNPIDTKLLMTATMDDGPAPNSFIAANVNFGAGTPAYNFEMDADNSAVPPFTLGTWGPVKGYGSQPWQRYPRRETKDFTLIRPASAIFAGYTITANEPAREGLYNIFVGHQLNDVTISTTNVGGGATNDTIFTKSAIVPHDIRVEAGIYAEQGSFFTIPGRWFNPNPNDTRAGWVALGGTPAARNAQRQALFGNSPQTPFYGEPLDVRVTVYGSVTQNKTPPTAVQAEWAKKWGWIPREHGSSGELIPSAHVPTGYNIVGVGANEWVPNLTIIQDPVFATGRITGYVDAPDSYVRFQRSNPSPGVFIDYALAPMPRLPVSPTLAYYGEVNP